MRDPAAGKCQVPQRQRCQPGCTGRAEAVADDELRPLGRITRLTQGWHRMQVDQHRATDFIYEDELTSLSKKGVLTHLDLAFSRDQAEKIYVQNRMREKASELYAWLQEGAYFYVCGDASRMAKDVERALLQVIAEQSGTGDDGARDYLAQLKKEKRYVRDVY